MLVLPTSGTVHLLLPLLTMTFSQTHNRELFLSVTASESSQHMSVLEMLSPVSLLACIFPFHKNLNCVSIILHCISRTFNPWWFVSKDKRNRWTKWNKEEGSEKNKKSLGNVPKIPYPTSRGYERSVYCLWVPPLGFILQTSQQAACPSPGQEQERLAEETMDPPSSAMALLCGCCTTALSSLLLLNCDNPNIKGSIPTTANSLVPRKVPSHQSHL